MIPLAKASLISSNPKTPSNSLKTKNLLVAISSSLEKKSQPTGVHSKDYGKHKIQSLAFAERTDLPFEA